MPKRCAVGVRVPPEVLPLFWCQFYTGLAVNPAVSPSMSLAVSLAVGLAVGLAVPI